MALIRPSTPFGQFDSGASTGILRLMQSPTLVFDHVAKRLSVITKAASRKKLAELARSKKHLATSGRPSK